MVGVVDEHRRPAATAGCAWTAGLDLAQLDPVAVDLHLVVLAAEELDVAVGQVAAQVAGAVEPLAGGRMGDEALRGAGRIAEVAQGQPGAADVELARRPSRDGRAGACVEHVEGLVGQRPAVRDARPRGIDLADRVGDRPDRRLGGAAEADHLQAAAAIARIPSGSGDRDPVAGQQRQAQRAGSSARGAVRRQSTSICSWPGTEFQTVTPCRGDELGPVRGVAAALGLGQDQAPARRRAGRRCRRPTGRSRGRPGRGRGRPAPTAKRRLMSTTVFSAARWLIITPLGVPVEPEV